MSQQQRSSPEGQEDFVIQDGVRCRTKSPWSPKVSRITGLAILLVMVLAVYILARTSVTALIVWLILFGVFAVPLRYLVCARCPYYGQTCSTGFGRIVPHIFKKQEGASMKVGLWLDVLSFTVLFVIPLPYAWELGGIFVTLLWVGALIGMCAVLSRVACSVCPLTFCPIGRAGRALWRT